MSVERRFWRNSLISVFPLWLGVLLVFLFKPLSIHQVFAMGKPLPYDELHITRCLTQKVEGKFFPDASQYKLSGICTVFLDKNPYRGGETGESTFEHEKPIYSMIWVAETRYTPSNKATWEKIDLRYKENHRFTMGLESKMVCEWDPWRKFLTKPCESIFDTPKGEISPELLSHLRQSQTGIPFTSILNSDQRAALNKKYHVSLALQQKPNKANKNSDRSQPSAAIPFDQAKLGGSVPQAITDSPKITKPASGERVIQGQLLVQINPPRVGGGPVIELQFTWLDTPPNRPRYANSFSVDTNKLVQGYPVDVRVTQGQTGRWEVRARVSGKIPPGTWSPSTPFHLALNPPNQTQSIDIPKLGTSIFQSPQKGIEQQQPIFRPQPSPSQSPLGGTQFIRPRGIEENTAKDSPVESEKTP